MDIHIIALLFGAGVLGGCANAIAGGATLITFPAMVASGLTPLIANASNSVAVMPGNVIAALSDRASWPRLDARFGALLLAGVVCGAFGAWLLVSTSERSFMAIVPVLIGLATVLFACGPMIQRATVRLHGHAAVPGIARPVLIGAAAVYGGYFGAGVGVMFMGILSAIDDREVRTLNAMKNILAFSVAVPALVVFVASGAVRWPQTLVMFSGAAIGGFMGARLIRVISPRAMRGAVTVIGAVMTAVYAYRYWF